VASECPLKRPPSDPVRSALALSSAGHADEARACLSQHLSATATVPHLVLAAATAQPSDREAFLARARKLLKGKPCTRHPASYDVLGPLPIGKNEVDGDPVADFGGAFAHWLRHHNATTKRSSARVASELVPGGQVGWKAVRSAPDGRLSVSWPALQPAWSSLVQSLGQRAVLEMQAHALGTLAVVECGTAQRPTVTTLRTLSSAPSPPHPLLRTLSSAPSPSHPLLRTLSSAPSPPHPLLRTLSSAPSPPQKAQNAAAPAALPARPAHPAFSQPSRCRSTHA
jgi:hypothetical protein